MAYIALQFALMLVGELFIIRAMVKCLSMQSNYLYAALHLTCFTVGAIVRIFGATPYLRAFIIPLCYLVFPLALSTGPLRARLYRIALIDIVAFGTEMIGVVIYSLLTGGTMAENTANQSNIATIAAIYSVLIPVMALALEMVIAAYRSFDRQNDAQLELSIVALILSAVIHFFLIYLRFFPSNEMAAPVAVSALAYCLATIASSFILLTVAQRDARVKREVTDQIAEARQVKHVRSEVEATTLRSMSLRRLRHDLANQMRVVTGLISEGRYDDADRYLAALQDQAHGMQGMGLPGTSVQEALLDAHNVTGSIQPSGQEAS
jgi:hypothetical protein